MEHLHLPPTTSENYRFRNRKGGRARAVLGETLMASVPLSRKEVLLKRKAIAITAFKAVTVVGLVFMTATFAVTTWKQHVVGSRRSTLKDVIISGSLPEELGGLTRADIMHAAGLNSDASLWDVDLSLVKENISKLSQIRSVEVERVPPAQLKINVEERQPLAWLVTAEENGYKARDTQNGRMLDSQLNLLACRKLKDALADLPEIHTTKITTPEEGKNVVDYRLRDAMQLLEAVQATQWPTLMQVEVVDATSPLHTRVTMKDGVVVDFPTQDAAARVPHLKEILQYTAQNRQYPVATVRMQQTKNIAVTYRMPPPDLHLAAPGPLAAAAVPPQKPKAAATAPKPTAAEKRPIRRLSSSVSSSPTPVTSPRNTASIDAILRGT